MVCSMIRLIIHCLPIIAEILIRIIKHFVKIKNDRTFNMCPTMITLDNIQS